MTDVSKPPSLSEAARAEKKYVSAPLWLLGPPPTGVVCCRCDEVISDLIAVNVPGLFARGWSHRTCLPRWLLP